MTQAIANCWSNLLCPPVQQPKVTTSKRSEYTQRTLEHKRAIGLRICNQMFRQEERPSNSDVLERLLDEAQMQKPQANKYLRDYIAEHNIAD